MLERIETKLLLAHCIWQQISLFYAYRYPDLSSIYAKLKVNKSTVGGLPRSPCTCFDYLRTPHSFMTLPVYNLTHKIYSTYWFPTEEVKASIGAMLLY